MVNIMEVYASWHENGNKQNDNAYINGKLCSASILSDEQKEDKIIINYEQADKNLLRKINF